jgi:hypothetical protein
VRRWRLEGRPGTCSWGAGRLLVAVHPANDRAARAGVSTRPEISSAADESRQRRSPSRRDECSASESRESRTGTPPPRPYGACLYTVVPSLARPSRPSKFGALVLSPQEESSRAPRPDERFTTKAIARSRPARTSAKATRHSSGRLGSSAPPTTAFARFPSVGVATAQSTDRAAAGKALPTHGGHPARLQPGCAFGERRARAWGRLRSWAGPPIRPTRVSALSPTRSPDLSGMTAMGIDGVSGRLAPCAPCRRPGIRARGGDVGVLMPAELGNRGRCWLGWFP